MGRINMQGLDTFGEDGLTEPPPPRLEATKAPEEERRPYRFYTTRLDMLFLRCVTTGKLAGSAPEKSFSSQGGYETAPPPHCPGSAM